MARIAGNAKWVSGSAVGSFAYVVYTTVTNDTNGMFWAAFDDPYIWPMILEWAGLTSITGTITGFASDQPAPWKSGQAPQAPQTPIQPPAIAPAPPVVERAAVVAPPAVVAAPVVSAPIAPATQSEPVGPMFQGIQLGVTPLRSKSKFEFSKRSLGNIAELSIKMQRAAARGLAYSPHDWVMVEAARTFAEQVLNVEKGVSKVLESRHVEIPAQAFDFYVFDESGKLLDGTKPEHEPYYRRVAQAITDGGADEGIGITSGALMWGWDWYHVERSRDELAFKWPEGANPDIALL